MNISFIPRDLPNSSALISFSLKSGNSMNWSNTSTPLLFPTIPSLIHSHSIKFSLISITFTKAPLKSSRKRDPF